MPCRTASVLCAVLFVASGCGDNEPALPAPAPKEEKLTRFTFSIDGKPYAISLPQQAEMRAQHDPHSVTFDARKNQRQMKLMMISAAPRRLAIDYDQTMRLRNGTTMRYRDLGEVGGGSGGAEFEIAGRIEIGTSALFLNCTDQTESVGFPDWCLHYLDTLDVAAQAQ
jgi:hypothetical protein